MSFDRWPAWVRLALALAIGVGVALLVPDDPGWLDFVALVPALVLTASVIAGSKGEGAGVFILIGLVLAAVLGALIDRVAGLIVLAVLPALAWWMIDRPAEGRPA